MTPNKYSTESSYPPPQIFVLLTPPPPKKKKKKYKKIIELNFKQNKMARAYVYMYQG